MNHSSETGSAETPDESVTRYSGSIENELIAAAGQADRDPVVAVHSVRKLLKKYRALLKLVKGCSSGIDPERANHFLRDLGRNFSQLRDAHVRSETLSLLAATNLLPSCRDLISELLKENQRTIDQLEHKVIDEDQHFDTLKADLTSDNPVQSFIESLNTDSKCLIAGLSETYAKCHRLYLELHNQKNAELLHEWRKRIKDLQHQHEMVSALLPSDLFAASENIDPLTERLGRDQDLNNLRLWINQDGVSQNHSV
ncbi:MAG: CHAD domain-containing protein, partial [Balneolaceae bacterium]|nr:CHAD domain-containing protein [Balneolaceae bacterium]